jgi:hypothetical protein
MITIKTATWFTKLPPDHMKVGISRGVPRGTPAGYKRYRALEPGPWFNSVSIPEYLSRYNAILSGLDPAHVVDELATACGDAVPVLLCYENPAAIQRGEVWCHRHLAAQWLEDRLQIKIEEVGFADLDRFAKLRFTGMRSPSYRQ